jgi:hypothetical protein
VTGLQLKVTPNPAQHYFNLRLESGSNLPVQLRVVDAIGRLIDGRENVAPNTTLTIGQQYRPGIYYVQVLQGSKQVTLILIKAAQ